jgi:tetratricopeptide (TPR) repeat protein
MKLELDKTALESRQVALPRRSSSFKKLAGAFFAMAACGASWGQRPPSVTAGELALLPEYCIDTQGFDYSDQYSGKKSPRADYWVGLMGQSFWHHHHYCWGLIKSRRAMAPGVRPELRTGGLKDANGDYDYVIRNATRDFVMLPEVMLKYGDNLVLLDSPIQALEVYAEAARRKPDYWPAYVNAAEALEKVGKKKEALARIGEGLAFAPTSPVLQRHYTRLGGDLKALMAQLERQAANASTPPGTTPSTPAASR